MLDDSLASLAHAATSLSIGADVASVSCTTRQPRFGETHGREYFFLTEEEFTAKVAAGDAAYLAARREGANTGRPAVSLRGRLSPVIKESSIEASADCSRASTGTRSPVAQCHLKRASGGAEAR